MENNAQISLEMIVLLAAVIALVLLIVTRLQSTGESATKKFDTKVKEVLNEIEDI